MKEYRKVFNLEKFSLRIFQILCFIFLTTLVYFSFTSTWHNYELASEIVTYTKDNLFINILITCVIFILFFLVHKYVINFTDYYLDRIAIIVSFCVFVISAMWTIMIRTYPFADQEILINYAASLINNDYSGFQKGGYLACYPYQIGLLLYFELIARIFGVLNFLAIQFFNCMYAGIIVHTGYKITKYLSNNSNESGLFFLIIASLCIPLYGLVPFCYGDIPSLCFVLLAFKRYLILENDFRIRNLFKLFVYTFLSLFLRKNSLIPIVAILLCVFIKIIIFENKKYITIFIVLIISIFTSGLPKDYYINKYSSKDFETPLIANVAMGLNTESGDSYGLNNGFVWSKYHDLDCSQERLKIECNEMINEFVSHCCNDPSLAMNFFLKKFVTQWNVPLFQFQYMTMCISDNPSVFADNIYHNGNIIRKISNAYQQIVYLFSVLYLLFNFKKEENLNKYSLLIAVFGGFVFSLIWENKARYIFPYFVLLLPYASIAIHDLCSIIKARSLNKM